MPSGGLRLPEAEIGEPEDNIRIRTFSWYYSILGDSVKNLFVEVAGAKGVGPYFTKGLTFPALTVLKVEENFTVVGVDIGHPDLSEENFRFQEVTFEPKIDSNYSLLVIEWERSETNLFIQRIISLKRLLQNIVLVSRYRFLAGQGHGGIKFPGIKQEENRGLVLTIQNDA